MSGSAPRDVEAFVNLAEGDAHGSCAAILSWIVRDSRGSPPALPVIQPSWDRILHVMSMELLLNGVPIMLYDFAMDACSAWDIEKPGQDVRERY